jgi:hypothetical protein
MDTSSVQQKHFDTSGKSPAFFYHRALWKVVLVGTRQSRSGRWLSADPDPEGAIAFPKCHPHRNEAGSERY